MRVANSLAAPSAMAKEAAALLMTASAQAMAAMLMDSATTGNHTKTISTLKKTMAGIMGTTHALKER